MTKFLFRHIDNSGLVVFRVIFGFLISAEAFGAIITGWVKRTLVEPQFTFSFINFEWLQPLPGNGMYFYFFIMGLFGLCVTFGYRYKTSMSLYTLLWAGVYFMQKAAYNNHYYLMLLLCAIMIFLPAHRYLSLDVKRNPSLKSSSMPQWCKWVVVLQVWLVFTFAAIAKIYPDWLDGTVGALLMRGKTNYWFVGPILQQEWTHYLLAYFAILFDALIVPMLLFKPTRKIAFITSLFFHMFNSVIFLIGIFPFMSISFALFFFSPKTIQKIFLPKKDLYTENKIIVPSYKKPLVFAFSLYFVIQFLLPLRHWAFKDNVLWTEEGHRLSWRMLLRAKSGHVVFTALDKDTGEKEIINYAIFLSKKQIRGLKVNPDFMWQFAQRMKTHYAERGKDVGIYLEAKLSVNGRPYAQFIDPKVDLAAEKWHHFKHHEWILPSKLEK